MLTLRQIETQDKKAASFVSMVAMQNGKVKEMTTVSCSTICQNYSVPGGCTPCGTKCMLYCVGK